MATRTLHRLTAKAVEKAKGPACIADGGGLYLQVGPSGNKSWLFSYMRQGQAREMGLGSLQLVSLAEARAGAINCRKTLLEGMDPIQVRNERRLSDHAAKSSAIPFRKCAAAYIEAHRAGWKNSKHADQWVSTLETYAYPTIGDIGVGDLDTPHILGILEANGFWHEKPETANRVRGRIEAVLDWATVRKYRSGPNPARWRGHLDMTLPKRAKVKKIEHHPALPYEEIPDFFHELHKQEGTAARALELIILTVVRTSECIQASSDEIQGACWTIPANRMKAGREHKVPLSMPALEITRIQMVTHGEGPLFPSPRGRRPISNMACLNLLDRMGRKDITVHGFRSTFRDWAAEQTNFSREVAEQALAHQLKDKVEAAYRRSDLFEKRRELMDEWAAYCLSKRPASGKRKGSSIARK